MYRKNKRISAWVVIFTFIFSLLPTLTAKASPASNINIISSTSITVKSAKAWAKEKGATQNFINLADLYWKYAQTRGGVNPAIAYAQSAKETGFGKFGGVINESYYNPCGLKTSTGGSDTDPNAHKKFNNWDEGVQAQLDHLALYAGASGYPRTDTYDSRHFASIKGQATTVVALGGRWAPSATYGVEIMSLYDQIATKQTNTTSHGVIDSPSNGAIIKANEVTISGWSLNPSGVNKINIYLDGVLKTTTKCSFARQDIINAYPGFPNSNMSGYSGVIDLTTVANGVKTITVETIGNDGSAKVDKVILTLDKPTPVECIDMAKVSGNTLTVSGWAINASGTSSVKISVDGKDKGTATIGQPRSDVASVYPQYLNAAKSGFNASVNISDIDGGDKVVKVTQMGNDGISHSVETIIKVNKLSLANCIDYPTNNSVISSNSLNIRGWVLNDSGISKVEVYVDGKYKGDASINQSRPDLGSVYSQYSNASKSGFSGVVNISDIQAGSKKVLVKQIGIDGTSKSVETTITIDKPVPVTWIDNPSYGKKVGTNKLLVSGWALNAEDVQSVHIYVDGIDKGTATIGQTRLDVKSVYPQYSNAGNSGFSKEVDISDVTGGSKIVKVVQTGKGGSTNTSETIINIAKLPAIQVIDYAEMGSNITNNTLNIGGWALNPNGVKEIKIYIDGVYQSNANINLSRNDVYSVYPQYNNYNSGYNVSINLKNIADGSRLVKVEQVGKDNTTASSEVKINIDRPDPITWIDAPSRGKVVEGNSLEVSGWALNYSGVKSLEIYVDDILVGTANTAIKRLDVKSVYPMYGGDGTSGYNVNVDLKDIKGGNRILKVKQMGNNGSINVSQTSIYINKLLPIQCIDAPSNGQIISSKSVFVRGWAVNPSTVKSVEIYVDGVFKGNAKIGIARSDVQKVYPQYLNSGSSGYEATIDINNISPGKKVLEVRQIGNDTSVSSTKTTINIVKKAPILDVDYPGDNLLEKGDSLFVGGWTLNVSGVKQVNLYVDDNKVSNLSVSTSRPDVIAAYPGYQTDTICGYGATINISKLAMGVRHILKVESVGVDGTTTTVTRGFYYKEKRTTIVIDPGHNYGGDYGAESTHNGVKYSETEMNMPVALKLQSALEAQGYIVVLTRSPLDRSTLDRTTSLRNRAILANNLNADLFISIHHNSAGSTARGSEVFYTERTIPDDGFQAQNADKMSRSMDLASATAKNMSANTGFNNRGSLGDIRSLGYSLSVLRNTKMPAILVECGFISNPTEASLLANPAIQQATVNGIAAAVSSRF